MRRRQAFGESSFRSVMKMMLAQRKMMLNTVRVVRNLCVQSQSSLLGQLIKCKLTLKVNDKNAVYLETLAD